MSQRFISTSFWDDSWVQELSAEGKLLYMYLLTNPLTNIAGVYKITIRRISFDTGMTLDAIKALMAEFEQAGKAAFVSEYIILPNWPKHQKLSVSGVRAGLERILKSLPAELLPVLQRLSYQYPIKEGSTPLEPPSKALEPPIKDGSTPQEPPLNRHTNTLDSKLKPSGMQRASAQHESAAAAAVTSGEVATALSSCPFASRLTGTDHGHIAERLTGLSLGLGFVGYCVERTREAKPKNPGGFLRAALYGTAGFEGYPEAYQEQARKPAPAPARKPAPQTCAKCGSPLKLITDEAVCPDCGAAWYWDEDWQSWEQSSETWQGFDVSSGIAALRAKAGDQKQTPAKQTAKQTA
jgi:hypothetical protein